MSDYKYIKTTTINDQVQIELINISRSMYRQCHLCRIFTTYKSVAIDIIVIFVLDDIDVAFLYQQHAMRIHNLFKSFLLSYNEYIVWYNAMCILVFYHILAYIMDHKLYFLFTFLPVDD